MPALTVRNLEDDIVNRLRTRAAQHGRSVEAEHRDILRVALTDQSDPHAKRALALDRLAEFRQRTGGRGGPSAGELVAESRFGRMATLVAITES